MTNIQTALLQRLEESLTNPFPKLTRRYVRLPDIPGKAVAVVGVRRAGKTSFLQQCLADRLAGGWPRESLVLLGLEDDRLAGVTTADLSATLEEYFRRYPGVRSDGRVALALDEIQLVDGWERFVRRIIDTEPVDVFLSGSSAKLLSREVATSLRGRGMEVLVHPFSFRESLRHAGNEPTGAWSDFPVEQRTWLDHRLRDYLRTGGFPEAQGVAPPDRHRLLRGYVDVVILRDVIERHAVSNPVALRWLQRQLLATPAGSFSVTKLFRAMQSQGLKVGKDTLYDYLGHLEDAFLIRTAWLHTGSERRRMVNPRKVYPVDPGLIDVSETRGRNQTGHALETAVFLELERRGYQVAYVQTSEGFEVDFRAVRPGEPPLLVQVAATVAEPDTLAREVRALADAEAAAPGVRRLLLTLDAVPPATGLPAGTEWWPASRWLLDSTTSSLGPG